jgi:hypothetical protein
MSRYDLIADDLLSRFPAETLTQLTDGETSFVSGVIEDAIDSEENDFDGFAGVYYTLPVRTATNEVPGVVRERLLDGVAIRLLSRKPEFLTEGSHLLPFWSAKMVDLRNWKSGLSAKSRDFRIPDGVERSASVSTAGTAKATSDSPRMKNLKGLY